MISIGDVAPTFDLVDQHGRRVTVASCAGRRVMLVFLPLAFSGVCGAELEQLDVDRRLFDASRTEVIGVTVDSMFALRAWADAVGSGIRLLSDFWPHGAVAARYGAFDVTTGRATRTSVAINEQGRVVEQFSMPADQPRTTEMYERALARFDVVA